MSIPSPTELRDLNVTFSGYEGGSENNDLVVRTGEAEPIRSRDNVSHTGVLQNVSEHLLKVDAKTINDNIDNCQLSYSYHDKSIAFTQNWGSIYLSQQHYVGQIKKNRELDDFRINNGRQWDIQDLSNFLKMNRTFFKNKNTAMKLVSDLRNFKAKVNSVLESANDRRGNVTELKQQAVESNIPESFHIEASPFIGGKKSVFEVEVEINPENFQVTLISPDLKAFIEFQSENLINAQLDIIAKRFPKLRMFQQ